MTSAVELEPTLTATPARPMLFDAFWVESVTGEWSEARKKGRRGFAPARVPIGTVRDADRAVEAARAAFPAWRALHLKERQHALRKIADALERSAEASDRLTSEDTGNALRTLALQA